MKMRELADKWLNVQKDRLELSTYKNTQSLVLRFATEWDRTRKVAGNLNEDFVRDFLADVRSGQAGGRGKVLAASTHNKNQERLRGFLKYLVTRRVCSPYVLDGIYLLTLERVEYTRIPLAVTWQMIDSTPDPWERWVLAYASQTLGRDSELRSRKIRHLRINDGVMDWYRKKTKSSSLAHVEMFVTEDLEREWKRWALVYQSKCGNLQPDWPLIPQRANWGGPRTQANWRYKPELGSPKYVGHIVQKHALRVLGWPQDALKGQGGHLMRRSMARALYDRLSEQGDAKAIRKVMVALGHTQQTTTERYIGINADVQETNALMVGSNLLGVDRGNVVNLLLGLEARDA